MVASNVVRLRPGIAQGYGNVTKGRFVRSNGSIKISITKFLKQYAPNFCWCTARDLLKMCEVLDEDVEEHVFMITLSKLRKQGYFITRDIENNNSNRGRQPKQYLRVK